MEQHPRAGPVQVSPTVATLGVPKARPVRATRLDERAYRGARSGAFEHALTIWRDPGPVLGQQYAHSLFSGPEVVDHG
jgi:hypothetical protein